MAERVTTDGAAIVTSGARIELRAGHLQTRPGDQAFVDGVAQLDGGVGVGRAHVLQGGEAGVQILQRVIESRESGAGVVRLLLLHQMHVAVDQAGQHGGAAEIDNLSAGRNLDAIGGAGGGDAISLNGGDAISLNKDDLIGEHRARFGIEQAAGADGDACGRRSLHVHARSVEGAGFGTGLRVDGQGEDENEER